MDISIFILKKLTLFKHLLLFDKGETTELNNLEFKRNETTHLFARKKLFF